MRIECLTPDFNGRNGLDGVALVANSGLDVYAHNVTAARPQPSPLLPRGADPRSHEMARALPPLAPLVC